MSDNVAARGGTDGPLSGGSPPDALEALLAAHDVLWEDYLNHDNDCPHPSDMSAPCTCGLLNAMEALSRARSAYYGAASAGAATEATLREIAKVTDAWHRRSQQDMTLVSAVATIGSIHVTVHNALRAALAGASPPGTPEP